MAEIVMRKNLSKTGLSMSQAQTVSNLANQNAFAMTSDMALYNNARKTINFKGEKIVQVRSYPIPGDIAEKLNKVGNYHALQAFLMENIKTKDQWLNELKNMRYEPSEKLSKEEPAHPTDKLKKLEIKFPVPEQWGWEKLSTKEMAEYWKVEALAAHYGQFIHKGGKLDLLRKQLPLIQGLEWHTTGGVNGDTYPINVVTHHEIDTLMNMHNDLANKHKAFEQKVNYFKAKVKNLVTEENAKRAKENGIAQAEANQINNEVMSQYRNECLVYEGKRKVEETEFEEQRNNDIKAVAALRIQVDPIFQDTVDELMPKVNEVDDDKAQA